MNTAINDVWFVLLSSMGLVVAAAVLLLLSLRKGWLSAKACFIWAGTLMTPSLLMAACCISWLRQPSDDGAEFLLIVMSLPGIAIMFIVALVGACLGIATNWLVSRFQASRKSP